MKKTNSGKLRLDRETLAPLQLDNVVGGVREGGCVTCTQPTRPTQTTQTVSSPIHTCLPPSFRNCAQ